MTISVASGKGGTGKTTVTASLIKCLKRGTYIDCDVEEPNGHLMLHPNIENVNLVTKYLPEINYEKCTFCGKCVEVCEFNALINIGSEILIFGEMCHSCGACSYFCPELAIKEIEKPIGQIRKGIINEDLYFIDGLLNIGEASAVPVISKVKKQIREEEINIIDSPPGTSCSMVETVKGSDYCILVTESSPFGLNDLKLAVSVLSNLKIPFGVVINKYDSTFRETEDFLNSQNIELLLKIPFDREIAFAYSIGKLPIEISVKLKGEMIKLLERIINSVRINHGY